jgi:hypothetical protein
VPADPDAFAAGERQSVPIGNLTVEELYADRLAEQYEILAHHFSRAEDWGRTLDYLVKAAEKATQTFANSEPRALLRQRLLLGLLFFLQLALLFLGFLFGSLLGALALQDLAVVGHVDVTVLAVLGDLVP